MTGRGNLTRRGKTSWRLKFEGGDRDPVTGKRRTRYVTVRGTKREAQAELTRRLAEIDNGTDVDPSKLTVAEYLRTWLDSATQLSPKTLERYRELAERQIVPHLGKVLLQRLRPSHVAEWHATLLKGGGRGGRPLAPRTVGHAHRVLHAALARGAKLESVSRNVASVVAPPRIESEEVECLAEERVAELLVGLAEHPLLPIAVTALGTGMRRGELCGLQWGDIDLDAATLAVDRSLEQTDKGLRLKAPKSRHGRRRIALPSSVVDSLRAHRRRQAELRLQLGLGRQELDGYVFCELDGSPFAPDLLSQRWRRAADGLGFKGLTFHALRHTHASALIAAGLDVVTVSRRLGHGSPGITLGIYAHRFGDTDKAAALAMDAALRKR